MIAIVSHDAGGAEILSSWVMRQSEPCCLVLGGPALGIFGRKLGKNEVIPLAGAIEKADWLLCGTSWQSDLERKAIEQFQAIGKKAVAFLDHWKNYRERFISDEHLHLPDEIWVGDDYANNIAREVFPAAQVVLQRNPYFEDLQLALSRIVTQPGQADSRRVLYVCEPTKEGALLQYGDERYWGYTEEDAIEFFLKNIDVLDQQVDEIVVRTHPSEMNGKYEWVKRSFDMNIRIGGAQTLLEEIAAADIVVGCESMAMVVGVLAHKRVVSCIPPGGKKCCLPQAEIEHLQYLAAARVDTKHG